MRHLVFAAGTLTDANRSSLLSLFAVGTPNPREVKGFAQLPKPDRDRAFPVLSVI